MHHTCSIPIPKLLFLVYITKPPLTTPPLPPNVHPVSPAPNTPPSKHVQDFHLAKRYYDQAIDTDPRATVPVMLALMAMSLHIKWHALTPLLPQSVQRVLGGLRVFTLPSHQGARCTWNRRFLLVPWLVNHDGHTINRH